MQCIKCGKKLRLQDYTDILRGLPREEKASLRGYLAAQLRTIAIDHAAKQTPPKKKLRLPCFECLNGQRLDLEYIKIALKSIPIEERSSIQASLGAQLRKTLGREGGRPRSATTRCPCRTNTLRRAQMRAFDCCRHKGISQKRITDAKALAESLYGHYSAYRPQAG